MHRAMDKIQKLALGSIFVGTVVFVLKYAAYYITGSIALYSDALESVINVVTAVSAFMAVRLSAAPADANHPTGTTRWNIFRPSLKAC
jgi:divalent metal cation (Fe/Co/Zn/Cd) transporter